MSTMTCSDLHTLAAEFAFGLVDGVERADVMAHLDGCPACRDHVESLTATADALLLVGPSVEASSGFEQRVAQSIAASKESGSVHHLRWTRVALVAAVALIILGVGVVAGRVVAGQPSQAAVRSAAMVTEDGRTIGRVAVGTDPDTVFVAVPGWRPPDARRSEAYQLRLTLRGGRTQLVGPVDLQAGDGSWGTVLAVDARDVGRVALVDQRGTEYCAAKLA